MKQGRASLSCSAPPGDGGSFVGSAESPSEPLLYFHGLPIRQAAVASLKSLYNFGQATDIVVGGGSAGEKKESGPFVSSVDRTRHCYCRWSGSISPRGLVRRAGPHRRQGPRHARLWGALRGASLGLVVGAVFHAESRETASPLPIARAVLS